VAALQEVIDHGMQLHNEAVWKQSTNANSQPGRRNTDAIQYFSNMASVYSDYLL
jgi:hypothetical protein